MHTPAAAQPNQVEPDVRKVLSAEEQKYLASLAPLRVPLIEHQPPLSYLKDGKPAGYLNALLGHVAQSLGLTLSQREKYNYAQSLAALERGEADLLNDYSAYGSNREFVLHTRPVLTIPFVAVGQAANAGAIRSVDDLTNKKLVLVSGFQQTRTIQQRYPHLEYVLVESIDLAYGALRSQQADYYIDNATHAGYLLRSTMSSDLRISGQFPSREMGMLELRFAVHKDRPLLLSAMQKALDAIDSRFILALRDQWIMDIPQQKLLKLNAAERAWLAAHPQIRLASDPAWPPFETIDKHGDYRGIASDYMKLVESRLGIKFITSPARPWSEITEMVKNRELDVFSCAMETPQRNHYATFTSPYLNNPMVIVTRDTVSYIDGPNGLIGKSIAIEDGYASFELLSKNHPELELKPYPDSLSAVLAVSRGEAFAYVGNIANLSHIVRTHGITNTRISGQVPYSFELSMGVRSDWSELVPILQKALDSITAEEKNAILQKWIGIEDDRQFDYTRIWQASGLALALFIAILYWNFMLKRRVRERTSQLQHQAHYDALTDLPNRVLAFDRLEQLIRESERSGRKTALLFLDLDDFKKINDTLGHEAGDIVLKQAAERLRGTLRKGDTIGRLGGDEFIVVFGGLKENIDACPVAENLIARFRDAFTHDERELVLTASMGIAIYPDDGKTAAELLQNADTAMYHSKQQGRNTYSFFTDSMNQEVTRRLLLEEHMHGALVKGEFSLRYQPKIDVGSQQIIGVEALLRWHNPVLGDVSPFEFIPIAEYNGMIVTIGEFVLAESLRMIARWQKDYRRVLSVAVNLSPRQFRDPGLVTSIGAILETAAIPESSLELEITEGVLMSGHSVIDQSLQELKQLGISLAMDDFGTGYSSLSYLRKYPFDVIKIDREFIKDLDNDRSDQALVSATIGLAHALGLKVVAEGVETAEQLAFLADKGCDLAQGYYFSKPLTADEIQDLLNEPVMDQAQIQ